MKIARWNIAQLHNAKQCTVLLLAGLVRNLSRLSFRIKCAYRVVNRDFPYRCYSKLRADTLYLCFAFDMHRLRLIDLTIKLQRGSSAPAFQRRRSIANQNSIVYGPDVAAARKNGLPIVALESTIITHGLPYPDNLNTALRVEDVIKKRVRIQFCIRNCQVIRLSLYLGVI